MEHCELTWQASNCEVDEGHPTSVLLHRERVNKVFRKRCSRLLACFFKFFITAHLPLRRMHAKGHRFQCELRQVDHRLYLIVIIKKL
jgi:hypothetical protein